MHARMNAYKYTDILTHLSNYLLTYIHTTYILTYIHACRLTYFTHKHTRITTFTQYMQQNSCDVAHSTNKTKLRNMGYGT